jgi:hypothetical protein
MEDNKIKFSKKDIEFIEYEYGDSSVPPEYHRSYKIRVEGLIIDIVVDSYGDIINKKSFKLTEEDIKEIIKSLNKINFTKKYPSLTGCTGGISKTITIKTKTDELKTNIYYCGGEPSEKITSKVDEFAKMLISKIPKFSEVLKRT